MSHPTERPALKLAFRLCPWTLQTLGPIRFLSQLQAWRMSQFIVHADAAPVLLEEDDAIPAN